MKKGGIYSAGAADLRGSPGNHTRISQRHRAIGFSLRYIYVLSDMRILSLLVEHTAKPTVATVSHGTDPIVVSLQLINLSCSFRHMYTACALIRIVACYMHGHTTCTCTYMHIHV